ncbi:MAG: hypothetical protein FJZ90_03325 [Chloroflexi bacterium]|nr:hypothetical protein [Chloroflexota bacterium]
MSPLVLDVIVPAADQIVFGAVRFLSGALASAVLFITVVVIEGQILRAVMQITMRHALFMAFAVNLLSALAGLCLIAVGAIPGGTITLVGFVMMFLLTIVVETALVKLFSRERMSRLANAITCSLYMNMASYAFIGVLLLVGFLR